MTLRLIVILTVLSLYSAQSIAGPKDTHPLLMAEPAGTRPVPASPDAQPAEAQPAAANPLAEAQPAQNRAYYWSNGKKIPLNDTGLAVAKLKPDVNLADPAVKFSAVIPLASDPLSEHLPKLREAGFVLVNTQGGPGALDLRALVNEPPAQTEYVLPIVEPAEVPAAPAPERPEAMRDDAFISQLIMTPRISARFQKEMKPEAVQAYIEPFGLKIVRKQEYVPGGYTLELRDRKVTYVKLLNAANQLYEKGKADEKVQYAHPSFIPTKRKYEDSADPKFNDQWHLNNTGQGNGKAGADVRAVEAWGLTEGKPEIIIGVIDDSVQRDHPDLQANWKTGRYYDGVNGTQTDDPSPKNGTQKHGTSCAGVAVAVSGNGICGRGVAPKCNLIGVNFWDATTDQTAEGFYFCEANGAAVISCSWSWGAAFDDVSTAIGDLATNGRNGKGVVILFAAGNEYGATSSHQRFSSLSSVITVGATNWKDDHSPYSNFGPELSVVAPSSDVDTLGALGITTTDNTDNMPRPAGRNYSGYGYGPCTNSFGGTSSATPLAAGVCALMLSVNPNLTAAEVRTILEDTAERIPGDGTPGHYTGNDKWGKPNHSTYYGHGRIDAKKAVDRAAAGK